MQLAIPCIIQLAISCTYMEPSDLKQNRGIIVKWKKKLKVYQLKNKRENEVNI